ncbi:hypothetical protein [Streptomyces specialis]|uniref:hypothetical protein n=1 Tax=Streptomyces specialis TaxID=498367 RepID=UPI00073F82F8|nr:hypothetical protein [Streptomyces specialis]
MPFTVREDIVRNWLTELIVCRELQEAFTDVGTSPSAARPPIDMAWSPATQCLYFSGADVVFLDTV